MKTMRHALARWRAGALYRWLCRRIAIRAHTILRSDRDRHLHDHPSWSISIVLEGGYWEVFEPTPFALSCPLMYRGALETIKQSWIAPERAGDHLYLNDLGIYWRGPGAVVIRRAGNFHRLILPRATIAKSIFIMGRRTNACGFLTPHGKIGWRAYLASADATTQQDDESVSRISVAPRTRISCAPPAPTSRRRPRTNRLTSCTGW